MLKLLTGKCLLSEKVRTERIKLQLLLEKLVTGEWVGLIWLRIGHNDITVRDFGLKWFRIGYSDVFCPRFIPIGHNDMFSVRDFAITWLWIGHSDVFSVRDLFQSDTMKCFLSEILELHDSESDTVTCFLSEIYSNRTQWHVFCPRFIPIGHNDMFSVRDFGLPWPRIGHSDVFSVRDFIPIGHSDMFSVRDFGFTWLRIGHGNVLYVREFGHPNPVTMKYVIIVTRDVSFINISSFATRIVANRLVHIFFKPTGKVFSSSSKALSMLCVSTTQRLKAWTWLVIRYLHLQSARKHVLRHMLFCMSNEAHSALQATSLRSMDFVFHI